jgi:hypothetical protein
VAAEHFGTAPCDSLLKSRHGFAKHTASVGRTAKCCDGVEEGLVIVSAVILSFSLVIVSQRHPGDPILIGIRFEPWKRPTSSGTTLLVLPGDGIGPEIVAATLEVLDAADRQFKLGLAYESADIGFAALAASGTTTPEAVVERAKQAAGVILGPVSHNDYPPVAQGGLNPSGELRRRLDLFANIRPARSRPGLPARCGRAHPDSR